MADRVMCITWGNTATGREELALEALNEAVGLYGRMQGEGRIESFDLALLPPQGGIRGYIALKGTARQLDAVREDREFQRGMMKAQMAVQDLAIAAGYTGAGIAEEIAIYQEVLQELPQTAAT